MGFAVFIMKKVFIFGAVSIWKQNVKFVSFWKYWHISMRLITGVNPAVYFGRFLFFVLIRGSYRRFLVGCSNWRFLLDVLADRAVLYRPFRADECLLVGFCWRFLLESQEWIVGFDNPLWVRTMNFRGSDFRHFWSRNCSCTYKYVVEKLLLF